MRWTFIRSVLAMALPALIPMPANAEVVTATDTGFIVASEAVVPAGPMAVWEKLRTPALWWSPEHSWSGDAANFYMDAQAGGCFCEKLPATDKDGPRGSALHALILFSRPGSLLRLSGAFGPLQGEALTDTLSIILKPADGGGTSLRFEYVVGGYARFPLSEIAPQVDAVMAQQHARLAALFAPTESAKPAD